MLVQQLGHQTHSLLLTICEENPPVTGGLPSQRPVVHKINGRGITGITVPADGLVSFGALMSKFRYYRYTGPAVLHSLFYCRRCGVYILYIVSYGIVLYPYPVT